MKVYLSLISLILVNGCKTEVKKDGLEQKNEQMRPICQLRFIGELSKRISISRFGEDLSKFEVLVGKGLFKQNFGAKFEIDHNSNGKIDQNDLISIFPTTKYPLSDLELDENGFFDFQLRYKISEKESEPLYLGKCKDDTTILVKTDNPKQSPSCKLVVDSSDLSALGNDLTKYTVSAGNGGLTSTYGLSFLEDKNKNNKLEVGDVLEIYPTNETSYDLTTVDVNDFMKFRLFHKMDDSNVNSVYEGKCKHGETIRMK